MRKKISSVICGLLMLCMLVTIDLPMQVLASDGTSYVYDGYTYDYWGDAKESPAAFILENTITQENMGDIPLSSVVDVCTSKDGRIFMVDSVESRVNVFDEKLQLLHSMKVMRNDNGKIALDESGAQIVLSSPEGLYVHEKEQELYIADTGAQRILVLDLNTYALKKMIGKPENLTGVSEFKPSKITVDFADRIYVVVQSSYEGILELTRDGSFSGYYGVNVPRVNFIDYFWKSIASEEQKAQIAKTYAPAFNNITLDGEGFVMAVTYDLAADDMVFRLNSKGENVLREEGQTFVIGDIWSIRSDDVGSQFVDLAVTDYGTYALLDKNKGRIFLYNFDGELLNVFGSLGNVKGEFKEPTSIAWFGNKLVVADKTLKCLYIMAPTQFGEAVLAGNESYYFGRWDEALVAFEKAVAFNANYEPAYSGIGKNYLMKDEYEKAMEYFKLGNNRIFYSKAFNGYRGELLESNFGFIMALMVVLIVALGYSEVRYHQKGLNKKREEEEAIAFASQGGWKSDMREKLYYVKRALFHPFDGFYEIRFRNKGNFVFAVISILLFGIVCCVDYQYTGFIMNMNQISSMNSISIFSGAVFAFVLFIISNWSVTTLVGGKGNTKHITIVCGYALIPVILAMLVRVIFSNFVIMEEVMILNVVFAISIVWFLFLMLSGLTVVHEYSFGKNIASIFLTFVAAAIIIFLGILFFTLIEQMVFFIISVGKEFIRRL